MRPRHPLVWLMTDERMGGALWPALRALPPGSGVVLRHYAAAARERRALFARVHRIAWARRLVLVVAGEARLGAAATHGKGPSGSRPMTWPAHSRRQAIAGKIAGAQLLFISPVFATRSHPRARGIGPGRALAIGKGLGLPIVALGGMNARRFRRIAHYGFDGWAAIDALHPPVTRQKRKAVPR